MDDVFNRLRPVCVQLTQRQTRENVRMLSSAINTISDDGQLQALQDYLMFPLRLILKAASPGKTTELHLESLICLKGVISRTEIKQWDTLKDLFTSFCILISTPPGLDSRGANVVVGKGQSEEFKLAVVECLESVIRSAGDKPVSGLYEASFLPVLGHAISLLLDLLSSESYHRLRATSGRCLLQLLKPRDESSAVRMGEIFASFLPGLTLSTTHVITADYKQHHTVTCTALSIWIKTVTLVMGSDTLNPDTSKTTTTTTTTALDQSIDTELAEKLRSIRVSRSEEWLQATAGKLGILIDKIMPVTSHPKTQVRLVMIEWAELLIKKCRKTMPDSTRPALEVLVQLTADDFGNVSLRSHEALLEVRALMDDHGGGDGRKMVEVLSTNLHDLSTRLPRLIRGSNDEEKLSTLVLLTGYVQLLGCRVQGVLRSASHLQRLSLAMVHVLELDVSHIEIVQEVQNTQLPALLPEAEKGSRQRFYFKHFHDERILKQATKLCQLLGYYGDLDVLIDHFLEMSYQGSMYQKQAIFIISEIMRGVNLTTESTGNERNKELIKPICSGLLSEYLSPRNWDVPTMPVVDTITPTPHYPSSQALVNLNRPDQLLTRASNILHICLLLDAIAALAEVLGREFRIYLVDLLYPLMEKVADNVTAVSSVALTATQTVAVSCGYGSIEELVCENSDYLVNAVTLRLRHIERYERSPFVLQAILTYTANDILPLFEEIIQEVILVLDECYDTNAQLILHVLFTLVRSIITWHPPVSVDKDRKDTNQTQKSTSQLGQESDQEKLLEYILEYHKTKITAESGMMDFDETGDSETAGVEENQMEDDEEEEEEVKRETPQHIEIVKQVLERCRHLLSAPDVGLRMLVLRTVAEGCTAMQSEPDQLLPLVHKLWDPFVQRFLDESPVVCLEAVHTLSIISRTTGDFLVRRLSTNVLPPMVDFLTKQAKASVVVDRQYRFSSTSKQQVAVMDTLAEVCTQMSVRECQLGRVVSAFVPYLSARQPVHLQQAAVSGLRQLLTCDPDVVWLSLIDLYCPETLLTTPQAGFMSSFKAGPSERNEYTDNVILLLDSLKA